MKTKLLGVVGSLNRDSLSRGAVRRVLEIAAAQGAEVRALDLLETALPLFDPHRRDHTAHREALEQVAWANAYLLGTPDYHGSMSGVMKNFLDYFWKEFAGKLFGYLCASHEKGLTAMDHMRTAVRQCYGWSLPYGVSVSEEDLDKKTGKALNPKFEKRLHHLAYDLTTYAPLLRGRFELDITGSQAEAGFASHYRPRSASA